MPSFMKVLVSISFNLETLQLCHLIFPSNSKNYKKILIFAFLLEMIENESEIP
ncbi:MAG: hypothetical protein ACJAVD_000439 [Porticoccaceae bacterium]|jgi:hypothetical protein